MAHHAGAHATPEELGRQLWHAAADNASAPETRLSRVRALLDAGAPTKHTDDTAATPLHVASFHGDEDVVRALVDAGAALDAADADGATALHRLSARSMGPTCAVGGSSTRSGVAALLVSAGANTMCRDGSGRTPLHWACGGGHVATARVLLDAGADVDATDLCGLTALMWACMPGSVEVVRLLLERGADTEKAEDAECGGFTALLWACERGDVGIVQLLLLGGARESAPDAEGSTPEQIALDNDRLEVAQILQQARQARLVDLVRHAYKVMAAESEFGEAAGAASCDCPKDSESSVASSTHDGLLEVPLACDRKHRVVGRLPFTAFNTIVQLVSGAHMRM